MRGVALALALNGKAGKPLRVSTTSGIIFSCVLLKGFPAFPSITYRHRVGKPGVFAFLLSHWFVFRIDWES
jgi:hypothetical protein